MESIKRHQLYIWSIVIPIIMIIIVMIFRGVVPFGTGTFAFDDANIQYLDLYAYLKDVLSGEQSIAYTFNKGLGGGGIGIFSYYLASPFNLLVVFFQKENLEYFFSLLVVLKITMSSLTSTIFLCKVFNKNNIVILTLSLSYAFSGFVVCQLCNNFWYDGVYMLPLVLLGVHKCVQKNTQKAFLSIMIGLTIIFNWYTGLINVMFSGFWFVYLIVGKLVSKEINAKEALIKAVSYAISVVSGLLIGSVLLAPTIASLMKGRGQTDLSSIFSYEIKNILYFFDGFVIGSRSYEGQVSLYVGSIPIILVLVYFLCIKKINIKEKIVDIVMLIISASFFYFPLFILLFSLLKDVSSYWYRYSYIGIIPIIYIASKCLLFEKDDDKKHKISIVISVLLISVFFLVFELVIPTHSKNYMILSIVFTVCGAALLFAYSKVAKKTIITIVLLVFVSVELVCNAIITAQTYNTAAIYKKYASQKEELIEKLDEPNEEGFYRFSQTVTRGSWDSAERYGNLTANYDEGLGYNYHSLVSYTSDPDDRQRDFMNNVGYNKCGDNINVVNSPILGIDSLLGVQYYFSDYDIKGFDKRQSTIDGSIALYKNPYTLPTVFTIGSYNDENVKYGGNPFEYINQLYSELMGENIELYKKIPYNMSKEGEMINYELKGNVDNNSLVYGFVDFEKQLIRKIYYNNVFATDYNCWLSPRVFCINGIGEEGNNRISIEQIEDDTINYSDAQFYYMDTRVMMSICDRIQGNKVSDYSFEDGKVKFNVTEAEENKLLFTSVPFDESWRIYRNGQEIEPKLLGDCILLVPLEKGTNEILITYHVKRLKLGILLFIIGLFVTGVFVYIERKKRGRDNNGVTKDFISK